jgi:hypothetical protein
MFMFYYDGHLGMPCVPAGMPLYSQFTGGCGLVQVPSEFTVQKSGHLGTSGGHAPDALDWL